MTFLQSVTSMGFSLPFTNKLVINPIFTNSIYTNPIFANKLVINPISNLEQSICMATISNTLATH